MRVAYDGSGFAGFAPNPGVVTVGGTLGEHPRVDLASSRDAHLRGRTDVEVHAWGQVVTFDSEVEADVFDAGSVEVGQRPLRPCPRHP